MSLSKYCSTRETTNFARIARIILGPCTGVLQDILRREITSSAFSDNVKTFITNYPAYKEPPINTSQEELLYGGKYSEFDITLLYFLLRNVCSIPPHTNQWGNAPSPVDRSLSANIERIRIIRNEYYGHIVHFSLSNADFQNKWEKIFQIVKELESYLGTATDYQDTLQELKTCNMDPNIERAYSKKLLFVKQSELDVSRLKMAEEEIKDVSDPIESQLDKDIFEQWREDNKLFISTKACKEVERLTRNQNLVIVAGNSGSGKSAIIQHIALKYKSQGWVVKLVFEAEEIPKLYSSVIQNKTLFVLNDPIGKSVLDEIAYSSWETHEERLKTCMKKVKLLMSCRKYILADDRIKGLLKDQSNIIDISNDRLRLDDNEKQTIFNIHACDQKVSKNDDFVEIRKIDEYFPLLCKMYFSKDRTQDQALLTFFKEPITIVEGVIRSFRRSCKKKYCALVVLALLNTVPSVNDLGKNQNARKMFKIALELSGMQNNTPPHTIGDALETLNGYFVKKIGDTYQFYHDFVMDVTTFVFGTDYPTVAIKYADINFLRRRVRIKGSNVKNERFTIYVGDEHIDDLGKRLFASLFGKRFLHVVLNPCLKNENIAKVFIKELTDHPEKIEMLLKKMELPKEQEIDQARNMYFSKLSLLKLKNKLSPLCALVVFCNTQLSLHCLKALKQMQKDTTDNSLYFAVCCNGSLDLLHLFSKDQLKEYMTKIWEGFSPIHIASMFHNFEILLELLHFGVDVNSSCERNSWTPIMLAAGSDTIENEVNINNSSTTMRYKTIEILLKNGANINLCEETGKSALYIACQNGHDSTVLLLLSNGADINLCDKNGFSPLLIACQMGHDSTVELLLNNRADINLCEEQGASPLSAACKYGHNSIVQSLLSKEASINLCLRNGSSPLLLAIENGHASTVQLLLKNGAEINACTDTGCSPLSIACLEGYDTIVQHLLSNRADIDICDKNGSSPLLKACFKGYDSIVQHLLSNGANINLCDKTGYSPLIIACEIGHESTVYLLLSNGADINLCLDIGASPLFIACVKGYESIVELLLSNGADTNLCECTGASPLFIACKNGFDNIAHLLLSKGADINLCEKLGGSPLFVACQNEHDSIVRLLLNNGADINLCLKNGCSPLNVACHIGQTDIVKVLLSSGADTNLCEETGISPLISACIKGDVSTVQLLLCHGSDINLCEKYVASPLFVACENGHENIVQLLLVNGADINLCKVTGSTPLYRACEKGYENIVQLLLRNGANINACYNTGASPLYIACQNKHDSIVHLLLNHGADINVCLKNGASPLFIACLLGYDSTANLLLRIGANINLCDELGVSPLFLACKNGHYSTVQLLLDNGANINLCLKNGISPLCVACKCGHSNIVELLLSKGADINLRAKTTGASPIHIACDKGHDNIVQLLIMNGADINSCLENGASPLYFACQNGHTCIVQLLLSKGADTNACLKNGASPLFIARCKGYNHIEQILLENTGEAYRLEPITSKKLKDLFNSFHVELPDDPLSESFVREILNNEILQELVKTIHFLSKGIMLTKDIHNRNKKSSVKVIVIEIDVNNDGDQILKEESQYKLETLMNWEEDDHTKIILISSKDISVVQAKLIVFKKYKHVIKEKNIFLQHVFDEFDEVAKLVASQRLSSISTFIKLVLRCFTTYLYEIITEYKDEMLTPVEIKQLCLKVFEDVQPMGNDRNWCQLVADFIYTKLSGRGELVCADAWGEITTISRKTVEDLNIILMKLEEFLNSILPVDQNKQIEEWHKTEFIRKSLELQKYPSIIKYIAGRRDDKKEVVKVFLLEDNEEAKEFFVKCCEVSRDTIFEFVNVNKLKQSQTVEEIKETERKPRSVDNSKRKELLQIIRKNRKKIFARHSNVIGIRIGNVRQKRDLIEEQTCIILYCLDKTLIPFGEKPLPDSIEGWPCDVKEDFFMLGICPQNCPSTNKDFPELGCSIGIHSKNGSGSVGFLYESRKYGSGFLTASHVAIGNCHELHVDNRLLSNHPLGREKHLIVHPSWSDNKKNNRTVGEVVESFYGEYKLSEELYEGLDFAAVKIKSCRKGDKEVLDVINTDDLTYTEMVKKTGRSTGTTYGYLDEDVMFAKIEYPPLSGIINDFPELYIVKDTPGKPPFFRKGDSGAGVFVMGEQDKPLGIGIAFSKQSSETYVCKINEIVKRLGLTIVNYRE